MLFPEFRFYRVLHEYYIQSVYKMRLTKPGQHESLLFNDELMDNPNDEIHTLQYKPFWTLTVAKYEN